MEIHLDLLQDSFQINNAIIRSGDLLEDIRKEAFYEGAKEVPDIIDADCIRLFLRQTVEFIGEEWVVCLIFENERFHILWLENAKTFQQRSLIRNAASNPRFRKNRSQIFSTLKEKLNEMIGSEGENVTDMGNQLYTYSFDKHGVMLIQDNKLPGIVLYIEYEDPNGKGEQ